jgi:prepilin-type N-terminal cleavage/methylation domain-containing protein
MYARRRAFTLIEVLLVLAIMAVTTLIAVPAFVHSIRGNRLRTAARTVAMAGRYARSMALLRQADMVLEIHLDKAGVSVRPLVSTPPAATAPGPETPVEPAATGSSEENPVRPSSPDTIVRALERVRIAEVTLKETGGATFREGSCPIVYRSNGVCAPYRVTIMDEHGAGLVVNVDALASAVTSEAP